MSEPKSKSPVGSRSRRCCVHTRKSDEPGRNSHLKTALTRSDVKLKSGCAILNGAAGPPASGSMTSDEPDEVIVPASMP